jgi:hypothetical protein
MEEIDFDKLDKQSKKKQKDVAGDFPSIIASLLLDLPWMSGIFVFIIFIILNSDVFINSVLSKIKDTTKNSVPTTKGTLISGLILSLAFIVFFAIIEK